MKRTILMLTLILCILLTGCEKVVEKETFKVTAIVVKKDHTDSFTTYMYIDVGETTTMIPQTYPEQFNVTLKYENMVQLLDNQALYKSVSVGDEVEVYLYKGYNKDHELITQRLIFPN